jgi:Cu(I)/Ag(I) efflux system membrane protein CusA/SilA
VVQTSEAIAQALAPIPGALQVLADPVRDRNTLTIAMRERAAETPSIDAADDRQRANIERLVELATRGQRMGAIARDGRPIPVRMFVQATADNTDFNDLPIPISQSSRDSSSEPTSEPSSVKLSDVAMVGYREGPATIKRENGQLRNYVRVTLKDRDPLAFIADANRTVQANVLLPAGIKLEWTGQYEHARRTQATLRWIVPFALAIILSILYLTYRDLADAALMFIAVPGALAGGAICQWLLGYPLSLAVGVGYLACCGMAAATSMIMLVYLREAVAAAGPLDQLSLADLRQAVISGAAHRLRPKLLTETTMVFSLVPLLWSTGFGADVIRPMAAPVLGGILVADEVIDLLIPIAFYAVRQRRWRQQYAPRATAR